MAVKLEGTIKRFIGLSTDTKPRPGGFVDGNAIETIQPGSSFLESDTGRIFRWDGSDWTYPTSASSDVGVDVQLAMLQELQLIRMKMYS